MTNTIQNASIVESIKSYINAPDARTPAVYSIIEWDIPWGSFCGRITLTGSRSFINLEVSQTITFGGLKAQSFGIDKLEDLFANERAITLESTNRSTFELIIDERVFFEGKALEANTKRRSFGLEGPDTYASVRSN